MPILEKPTHVVNSEENYDSLQEVFSSPLKTPTNEQSNDLNTSGKNGLKKYVVCRRYRFV